MQWNTVQDAHEFLRYMLDRLHTELLQLLPGAKPHQTWLDELRPPRTVPNSQVKGFGFCCLKIVCFPHLTPGQATVTDIFDILQSLVTAVFGGTLQSDVTCLTCQVYFTFLDFLLLSVSKF